MLLDVLDRLVETGNTVIVIEHHLDVIKTADWIIDLGPEGGHAGGRVVVQGSPEKVANEKSTYTGRFLRDIVDGWQRQQTIPELFSRAGEFNDNCC